jgi:hypothetical protein
VRSQLFGELGIRNHLDTKHPAAVCAHNSLVSRESRITSTPSKMRLCDALNCVVSRESRVTSTADPVRFRENCLVSRDHESPRKQAQSFPKPVTPDALHIHYVLTYSTFNNILQHPLSYQLPGKITGAPCNTPFYKTGSKLFTSKVPHHYTTCFNPYGHHQVIRTVADGKWTL